VKFEYCEATFEVIAAVKIQVKVFRAVTPRDVVGYHRFGGLRCCLHLNYAASQIRRPRPQVMKFGVGSDRHKVC